MIEPNRWGTYRRFETGWMRMGKDACTGMLPGLTDPETGQPVNNFGCPTPTGLVELLAAWSSRTFCLDMRQPVRAGQVRCDERDHAELRRAGPRPLPGGGQIDLEEYPIILTTGRRIPVYFHSEHRQLPWCRELWPAPRLELNPADAEKLGLKQGDWAWIETAWGKVRQCVDLYHGIAPGWANAEHAWWFPELPAPTHGCTALEHRVHLGSGGPGQVSSARTTCAACR